MFCLMVCCQSLHTHIICVTFESTDALNCGLYWLWWIVWQCLQVKSTFTVQLKTTVLFSVLLFQFHIHRDFVEQFFSNFFHKFIYIIYMLLLYMTFKMEIFTTANVMDNTYSYKVTQCPYSVLISPLVVIAVVQFVATCQYYDASSTWSNFLTWLIGVVLTSRCDQWALS